MDAPIDEERKRKKNSKSRVITMEYIAGKEGCSGAYAAYFPSGFNPWLESKEESETGTKIAAYHSVKHLSRQKELVVRTRNNVDFVGSNFVGEASAWQPCSYLLGVLDKEKGSLKLMPLAGEKVFRMEPRLRGVAYSELSQAGVEQYPVTPEMGILKKRMLTEAFGSQKSRLRDRLVYLRPKVQRS